MTDKTVGSETINGRHYILFVDLLVVNKTPNLFVKGINKCVQFSLLPKCQSFEIPEQGR